MRRYSGVNELCYKEGDKKNQVTETIFAHFLARQCRIHKISTLFVKINWTIMWFNVKRLTLNKTQPGTDHNHIIKTKTDERS